MQQRTRLGRDRQPPLRRTFQSCVIPSDQHGIRRRPRRRWNQIKLGSLTLIEDHQRQQVLRFDLKGGLGHEHIIPFALLTHRVDLHGEILPRRPTCNEVDATVVDFRRIHLKSDHREFHLHEILGIFPDLQFVEARPVISLHAPLSFAHESVGMIIPPPEDDRTHKSTSWQNDSDIARNFRSLAQA